MAMGIFASLLDMYEKVMYGPSHLPGVACNNTNTEFPLTKLKWLIEALDIWSLSSWSSVSNEKPHCNFHRYSLDSAESVGWLEVLTEYAYIVCNSEQKSQESRATLACLYNNRSGFQGTTYIFKNQWWDNFDYARGGEDWPIVAAWMYNIIPLIASSVPRKNLETIART